MTNEYQLINGETEMRDLARVQPEELLDAGDFNDVPVKRDRCAEWTRWGAKMSFLRSVHAEIEAAGLIRPSLALE